MQDIGDPIVPTCREQLPTEGLLGLQAVVLHHQLIELRSVSGQTMQLNASQRLARIKVIGECSGEIRGPRPCHERHAQSIELDIGKNGGDSRKPLRKPLGCDIESQDLSQVMHLTTTDRGRLLLQIL